MILAFSLACTHWYPLIPIGFPWLDAYENDLLISNLQITSWRAGTRSRHCSCGWTDEIQALAAKWSMMDVCCAMLSSALLCFGMFCMCFVCFVLFCYFSASCGGWTQKKNVSIYQQWIFHHWNLYWIQTPHEWVLVLTCLNCLNHQNNFFLGRGQVSENLWAWLNWSSPCSLWDHSGFGMSMDIMSDWNMLQYVAKTGKGLSNDS